MNVFNSVYEEGYIKSASVDFIPWMNLKNSTILVTGATGLIGTALIYTLYEANKRYDLDCNVKALVRDLDKANNKFDAILDESFLDFYIGDVENISNIQDKIDYIIHGASLTASKSFVDQAVETIQTSVYGTDNLLKLAHEKRVSSFVYLSSMEVYGYPEKGRKVSEEDIGALSSVDVRNSYPISKLLCEELCNAYYSEYNLPTKIARLTQTFGPGVEYNDSRVFAYFARCAIEKKDINLKTKGETERSYLYIFDAITAILLILLQGKDGQVYNCADDNLYCSIFDMASIVANAYGIKVNIDIDKSFNNVFLKTLYMDLDASKLEDLGWEKSNMTISKMFDALIEWMLINR